MDATILNALRDPAGVPFYPVVFQALYILTWALHVAFVFLSLGSMGLSLYGVSKQNSDPNWKILTPHLIQTGKISVSLLIVLGVAPLLFTQVIYDPNWYTVNALSGLLVFVFIYSLLIAYTLYYWYYYANKGKKPYASFIGVVSFLLLLFCGFLMHNFSVESIAPTKWMEWYAPNGKVDTSGLNVDVDIVRLLFMFSLSIPTTGIFLQNYSDFISTRKDFNANYIDFVRNLGTKMAVVGLVISALLFVIWMLNEGMLFNFLSLITILGVVALFGMVLKCKKSYITTALLVVVALLISGIREYIKYNIMVNLGYDIYTYKVNLEIPSISMFLLTFISLGFIGVAFISVLAWKIGKNDTGVVYNGEVDGVVRKLGTATLWILIAWMCVYFAWGMFVLFKNSLF